MGWFLGLLLTSTIVDIYRPGRRLSLARKVLEQKLLLGCGRRSSLFDYYQSPVQRQFASLHYPALYSHNIEREACSTELGVGQLSLTSLWPVMLIEVGTNSEHIERIQYVMHFQFR